MAENATPQGTEDSFTVDELTRGVEFLLDWLAQTAAAGSQPEEDKAALVRAMKELHALLSRCYAPGAMAGERPLRPQLLMTAAAKDSRIIVNC